MVYHIMRDGSKPTDINGRVIKVSEASSLYEILKEIHRRRLKEKKVTKCCG